MFNLLPAEARLAHQLGNGVAVEAYAGAAVVGVARARTQLWSVLAKTGEHRFQDLVPMPSTLPSD